jgi:protein-disulfide isomerase
VVKKAQKKNQAPFLAILGGIAVVGLGALLWLNNRPEAPILATNVDANMTMEAKGYLLGNPDAPVQVLEWADFECPACSSFATLTEPDVRKRLVETGQVSFRFFDFPLSSHRNTWAASNAAACANDQNKFWEYHDELFARQDRWAGIPRPKGVFEDIAKTVALDVSAWEQCYDSQKHQAQIQANAREGEKRGVNQTPTFIIGTKRVPGAVGWDTFKAYVDTAMMAAKGASATDSAAKGDSAKP